MEMTKDFGEIITVNTLNIVDSPILNAFVIPQKEAGKSKIFNQVFITSGLIKKMFSSSADGKDLTLNQQELRQGVVRIAGVLAHELAHPLDKVDAEGLKANYRDVPSSQAAEIRADIEGALIAKEAGYPKESVYECLLRLFDGKEEGQKKFGKTMEAGASTHPQNTLRVSSSRLFLTLDRYEHGEYVAHFPKAVKPTLIKDLQALNKWDNEWEFKTPKTIMEAVTKLEKTMGLEGKSPKFKEIERLTPLQNYMMDIMTVGPNLAGLPHSNIPAGFINKLPVGILFIADHLCENNLIEIGKKLK